MDWFDSLSRLNATFATAESCTGGLLAKTVTDRAGVSKFYKGGIVSYANEVKTDLLGVSAEWLNERGPYNPETAEGMARGVCGTLNCDFGVSVTGLAGPGGGTETLPVGTVFVGFFYRPADFYRGLTLHLAGSRDEIRQTAVRLILSEAAEFLREIIL